jgi:antitoxin PrlF
MTTLTRKGQVTIPKRLRDHLGLKPGAKVDFEVAADGRVVVLPASKRTKSVFARLRGSAKGKGKLSTDEIMALTRG